MRKGLNNNFMKEDINELLSRFLVLLIAVIVYRVGAHIPIPGIKNEALVNLFTRYDESILGLFNLFSGGALERMSIFALGIIPYISASIIVQILGAVYPYFIELRKEGEAGRQKLIFYTRWGTVFLALIQAFGMALALNAQNLAYNSDISFFVVTILTLVAGTTFLMWLGELVTERGIGNGISMLIFFGIIAILPQAFMQIFDSFSQGYISLITLSFILFGIGGLVLLIVFVEMAQRRIEITHPQRHIAAMMASKSSNYLPLKVNMAGVIPPIFATSILLFPVSLGQWFGVQDRGIVADIALAMQPSQPLYNVLLAVLVIFFAFFYTSLVYNPSEVADNVKKSGAIIRGIRPGKQTADYIQLVVTRLTVFGSIYIAFISVIPQMAITSLSISVFFGGTSILIMVVVSIDFMMQVQSHLLSRHFNSMMKGNMMGKGRSKKYGNRIR